MGHGAWSIGENALAAGCKFKRKHESSDQPLVILTRLGESVLEGAEEGADCGQIEGRDVSRRVSRKGSEEGAAKGR
jgi:hypothetical protein